jgi:BspA type Leucine rich repeat region (6 copies)
LGADTLQSIGGKFTLNNLQLLQTLSFPFLKSAGDLSFQGLPNLNTLGFSANIQTLTSLNIQNTFLGSLSGLNPSKVNSIYVANNRMLQSLSFQVTSVSQSINVQSNGDQFNVQFPNLQTAQNITFRDCPTISIPSLMNVTGSLGFYENPLTTISAVNLTSIGQSLAITANPNLNNISFPALTSIGGGFQVQNNTALTDVTIPALTTIGGALDFFGGFTS